MSIHNFATQKSLTFTVRVWIFCCSVFHRYQRTEDSYIYPYKLIRLNSKFIKFRVVKVNPLS